MVSCHQDLNRYISLPFFCFIIFVFMLSNGSENNAVATPDIAEETNLIDIVYDFSFKKS
jgi:hypothetical protein